MTLQDSADNRIAGAGIQTRTGRKWSEETSVDQAESMLHLRDIIENTNTGRQGVGMSHYQQWSKASASERRTMVQAEVRHTEDDQRKAGSTLPWKTVGLDKVGSTRARTNMGGVREKGSV